ncbi:MAG: pilin [Parcubacteria group bacterium]
MKRLNTRRKKWLVVISRVGLVLVVLSFLLPLTMPGTVGAEPKTKSYSAKLDNPIGSNTLGDVIGKITGAFMGAIGAFAVAAIVYGGVIYISSAGNEESIKKGKSIVTYAVIGLAIAILAYVIVSFVITTLLGAK